MFLKQILATAWAIHFVLASFCAASVNGDEPSIEVAAKHRIRTEPTLARCTMTIRADGRTPVEAMKAYVEHRKRVRKSLEGLKAEIGSLRFSNPTMLKSVGGHHTMPTHVQTEGNDLFGVVVPQVEGEAPLNPDAFKAPDEDETKAPFIYSVTATMKVDWVLPTKDVDALLIFPETLAKQLKAQDLCGDKNRVQLTDEEKELVLQEMRKYGYSGQPSSGDTTEIKFVGILSDDEYKAGVRKAFEEARKEAERIAESTGQKIRRTIRVSPVEIQSEELGYAYNPRNGQYEPPERTSDRESISPDPEPISLQLEYTVLFEAEALSPSSTPTSGSK